MAQFVPLKVDTGTPEWSAWARKYPADGNGIPIIYVVRADGEMLYGRSGAITGQALPLFLLQHLKVAGRVYNASQAKTLLQAMEKATKALEQDDPATAVHALIALKKLGPIGRLGCYARPALEADELVARLTQMARDKLSEIEQQADSDEQPFDALVSFAATRRTFAALPTVKADLASVERKLTEPPGRRDAMKQAAAFERARVQARSARDRERGLAALNRIADRNADSPAGRAAAAELRTLGASESKLTDNSPAQTADSAPGDDLREWTDSSGKYRIRAKLLAVREGNVVLLRFDGRQVTVPLQKLSAGDQRYALGKK